MRQALRLTQPAVRASSTISTAFSACQAWTATNFEIHQSWLPELRIKWSRAVVSLKLADFLHRHTSSRASNPRKGHKAQGIYPSPTPSKTLVLNAISSICTKSTQLHTFYQAWHRVRPYFPNPLYPASPILNIAITLSPPLLLPSQCLI
jgi:hypothetical protein